MTDKKKMITEVGLYEKYKDFFWERDSGKKIECDKGWFGLIDLMCSKLMELEVIVKRKPCFSSIKQRSGAMVIQFEKTEGKTRDDAFDIRMGRIAFGYSQESMSICEVCGRNGSMARSESRTMKTLCDTHMKQMNYQR